MTVTEERLAEPATPAAPHPSGRRAWLVLVAVAGLLLVAVAFAVGGAGGGSGTSVTTNAPSSGGGTSSKAAQVPRPAGSDATESAPAAGPATAPSAINDKVVKTGEMDLEVARGQVPHVLDRLIAIATLERGFVAESHSADGAAPSGSVTLRVPVAAFDATLAEVRRLPGKVTSQQTGAQDVTSTYVDLQARIHSLSATRASFERLLERASSIGETLAVQSRITDVQTQIEQLQGQLRVLADQATYGTLTVTVGEKTKTTTATHHRAAGMSRAFHRSLDRFVGGVETIVGVLGPLLLVALLAGPAWVAARHVYRRLRRDPA